MAQVDLLYGAVMSGAPSRINAADSGLAAIRFRLRYLSSVKFARTVITKIEGVEKKQRRKSYLMSRNSAATAEVILAEVGCASWLGHARWADSANLINHLEKEYAIN